MVRRLIPSCVAWPSSVRVLSRYWSTIRSSPRTAVPANLLSHRPSLSANLLTHGAGLPSELLAPVAHAASEFLAHLP